MLDRNSDDLMRFGDSGLLIECLFGHLNYTIKAIGKRESMRIVISMQESVKSMNASFEDRNWRNEKF